MNALNNITCVHIHLLYYMIYTDRDKSWHDLLQIKRIIRVRIFRGQYIFHLLYYISYVIHIYNISYATE